MRFSVKSDLLLAHEQLPTATCHTLVRTKAALLRLTFATRLGPGIEFASRNDVIAAATTPKVGEDGSLPSVETLIENEKKGRAGDVAEKAMEIAVLLFAMGTFGSLLSCCGFLE